MSVTAGKWQNSDEHSWIGQNIINMTPHISINVNRLTLIILYHNNWNNMTIFEVLHLVHLQLQYTEWESLTLETICDWSAKYLINANNGHELSVSPAVSSIQCGIISLWKGLVAYLNYNNLLNMRNQRSCTLPQGKYWWSLAVVLMMVMAVVVEACVPSCQCTMVGTKKKQKGRRVECSKHPAPFTSLAHITFPPDTVHL